MRINGRAISTWEELDMAVSSKPDLDVEFGVRRDGTIAFAQRGAPPPAEFLAAVSDRPR